MVALSDDFIEIYDPEIDAPGLIGQVRARLEQRRQAQGYSRPSFPTYGAISAHPAMPQDLPEQANLYHHLRQANKLYNQVETAVVLASSPATSVPILGQLWRLIREQAHSLVLFYVNRSTAEQVNLNRHLVSVLNELTTLNQEQQKTITALQEEVETLRRQVEE